MEAELEEVEAIITITITSSRSSRLSACPTRARSSCSRSCSTPRWPYLTQGPRDGPTEGATGTAGAVTIINRD